MRTSLAFLVSALALPAAARAQAPELAGDATRGRAVFEGRGRCLDCHRLDGAGSYARGPSLDAQWAVGPALAQRLATRPRPAGAPDERPLPAGAPERIPGDAYLLQSLLQPDAWLVPGFDAGMPAAAGPMLRLERQDLADLLVYLNPGAPLRAVPELPAPAANPWDQIPAGDAQRGEELFFRPDDAACSGCHVVRLPRLQARYHEPFWRLGGLTGPELTRLALTREPSEVLAALLRPNLTRTGGYRDTMVTTQGERLLTGTLLADGPPGLLLQEASPAGPVYQWLDRADVASVTPVERSRMTHVFQDLLSVPQRLDLLAFLRQAARESDALGADGLPGHAWGALDPVAALYSGDWPEDAAPQKLAQVPGIVVRQ